MIKLKHDNEPGGKATKSNDDTTCSCDSELKLKTAKKKSEIEIENQIDFENALQNQVYQKR